MTSAESIRAQIAQMNAELDASEKKSKQHSVSMAMGMLALIVIHISLGKIIGVFGESMLLVTCWYMAVFALLACLPGICRSILKVLV